MPGITQRLLVGAVGVAVVASVVGCSSPDPGDDAPTSFTVAVDQTTYSFALSTFRGTLGYWGGQATWEPLVTRDVQTGEYVPVLAEDFELSDGNTLMKITLRDDVDFTDGTHLDAETVVEYFGLLRENNAGTGAIMDQHGLEITATGDYTIELATTAPMGDRFMMNALVTSGIASPESVQDPEAIFPAGTGPYLMDEHVPDVSISYVRNPDYRDPERFPFDELTLTVFTDKIAASNALKSGQVDATEIDKTLVGDVENAGFEVTAGAGLFRGLRLLDYEGRIVPALADVRVRRAIAMAFDQEAIQQALEAGYGYVDDQPFATGSATYIEGADDSYPYDVEGAKELLAEAGYPDGFDITMAGGPQGVAFYPFDYEAAITDMLGAIGVRVTFDRFADTASYQTALGSGEYPVQLAQGSYDNTLGSIAQENAFVGYYAEDETFMSLVRAFEAGEDGAGPELGEYLLEQIWYVIFVHTGTIWATTPGITLERGPLYDLNLDAFQAVG